MGLFSKRIIDKVQDKDIDGVRKRIADGYDLHVTDMFGMTALHEAAMSGQVEIGRVLLDSGARMDLQDISDFYPLGCAVNERHTEFALMLIERGATANVIENMGRTALQSAIKRDLPEVVQAMLESGVADPNVPDNGCDLPLAYIQKNTANKELYQRLLTEFSNLDNAIHANNSKAVDVVVQRMIQRNEFETSVKAYLTATRAGYALPHHRLTLLHWALKQGELLAFLGVLLSTDGRALEVVADPDTVTVDQLMAAADVPALLAELPPFGDTNGTLLHVAAASDQVELVRFLLFEGHMSPFDLDGDGKRPLDVITKEAETDLDDAVRQTLEYAMSKLLFDGAISSLLKLDATPTLTAESSASEEPLNKLVHVEVEAAMVDLLALSKNMTDIQDLRVLISFAPSLVTEKPQLKTLLATSFQRVVDAKLVLDDNDAIYFQKVLKQCRSLELLDDDQHSYWKLQLIKVNMESAPWAVQLKASVQKLAWRMAKVERNVQTLSSHFEKLRGALVQQEKAKAKAEQVEQMVTMVSTALMFVGGPMVRRFFDGVVNLNDPTKLLLAVFDVTEDTIQDFLVDKTKELVVQKGVGKLLGDAGIEPVVFAEVLCAAVQLDATPTPTPTLVLTPTPTLSETPTPTLSEMPTPTLSEMPTPTPTLVADDVGSVTQSIDTLSVEGGSSLASAAKTLPPAPAPGLVRGESVGGLVLVDIHEDLEAFPFHSAVQSSGGDLEAFLNIVQYIEDNDGDVNAVAPVHVHRAAQQNKVHESIQVEVDAAMFASYLGYVEIVKQLLNRPDRVNQEKKFVTIQRAQVNAKAMAPSA